MMGTDDPICTMPSTISLYDTQQEGDNMTASFSKPVLILQAQASWAGRRHEFPSHHNQQKATDVASFRLTHVEGGTTRTKGLAQAKQKSSLSEHHPELVGTWMG